MSKELDIIASIHLALLHLHRTSSSFSRINFVHIRKLVIPHIFFSLQYVLCVPFTLNIQYSENIFFLSCEHFLWGPLLQYCNIQNY